ncbi:MAG: hypothetical protein AAF840_05905 [Bacteroidota bacterium]
MILNKKPNQLFRCRDGSLSTHKRRGACVWHGGLRTGKPVKLGKRCADKVDAGVQLIPLEQIHVAHEWFQNRTKAYSERSVNNIVQAAQTGQFKWANLDAVTLWRNPQDDKLYVLSGHSRHEAFRRACAADLKAEGQGFCELPAKVVNVDLATAKKMALESNTLSTKETDLERAVFYRRQRLAGEDAGAMKVLAKRLEGRNANTILAFSYLNPAGRTWAALQALENGQADSKNVLKSIGRWVGKARNKYPQLTNSHEDELYGWLVTNKGYGSARGQVNSETKFTDRLASIINRRTTFGQLEERLNIQENITRSPVEQQYNAQLEAAKQEIADQDKELKEKIRLLSTQGATEADVARITAPIEVALRRARLRYQTLIAKGDQVRAAARNEISLFSVGSTAPTFPWLGTVVVAGLL